ncbi:PREDICTED: DNA mismatch repair protein Msh2 [Trachymyrmex septentrionalis]|uniref:DNA mismatch repair protein Msh2 n=1 Tax=Trachymyrmex septentrionalis TaxID=34720 RepID=UPI00084EE19F|nr:PREDICTED: DNA mismatch repair protein Msh2 [Trachymyrmex septentrionalis]XP_018354793.1 PREDICTED: DNA mismatch repair protein Msh2 [Trachymyrmex septentrionalis]
MAVQPNQQLNMDPPTQQSFVRFFKNLPEKLDTTIRFFNRSDYYTVHGSDALFAAQEIFKTTSVCKVIGAEPHKTEGVILNKSHFETFVRDLLLVKQYRVEVYINQGSSKNQNWILEYKGSPGNLSHFEDILFSNNDIAVGVSVIAVKLGTEGKSRVVGLSCVEVVSTLISVIEFQDNESFSNLESLIVTLAPKECLLIHGEGSFEFQTLKQLMERSNVMVTLRKKNEFASDSIVDDLNKLIKFKKGQKQNAQSLPEVNLNLAMSATSALIKYLDLTSDEGHMNQFKLNQIEQSRYIRLDSAAMKALNIEPHPDTIPTLHGNSVASILTLLDKCRTAQGHRLIAQWVRQPLKDLSLIKERHDIVELLVKNNELRSTLSDDYLKRIPDLQQLAKKLARKKLTLQDCYKIYLCVSYLPKLLEQLLLEKNVTALNTMIIEPLKELIEDMDKFQQLIEQTIDLDAAEKGDFMVNPRFADDLKTLKDAMDELEETIQIQLSKAANDLCMEAGKMIKLDCNQQLGYYFRITLKEEKILRNKKHYTILDSNKAGVRFRNNKLNELNDDFLDARNKYLERQKDVIVEIIEIAAGYSETVRSIGGVLACLDVLTAFSSAAVSANKVYVRPKMVLSEEGELNLIQVRHPCLEMQQGVDYIANDIIFKRDQCHFYIITGPNMGGKSTYIRSVGVTALMAHIGSFVPCDEATISLLDCILARVGADDSQLKGLSTFMMEMIETAAILKTATCNSLVIIDELGRGTSTYEGCGIAWSIAEHLARDIKSYCLFATHFHEITKLTEEIPAVKNQHVTALVEDDKLTLLYKVMPGICDQSFGLHVAKMANFPSDVIEFAKRKQAELEDYQGLAFEGSDNPQKKQKVIQEGEVLISQFLTKCKALDSSLSDADLESQVLSLKEDILSHKNPYVEALLTAY